MALRSSSTSSNETIKVQETPNLDECSSEINRKDLEHLSLNLEENVIFDNDEETPKAENPEQNWSKNCPGSIDLDEKFTTMTGSYSEILDEESSEEEKTDKAISKFLKTEPISSGTEDDISPTEELTIIIPDHHNFFSEGPNSAPLYETGARNLVTISSAPASLHVYPEPPLVDPEVLIDLENYARSIATSMDSLTENLTENLQGISALSVACLEIYRDSVCKTCDAVDSNIKFMYQLMAKCEELSKAMKPMYKLQGEIKDIRRLLDMFESAVFSGGT